MDSTYNILHNKVSEIDMFVNIMYPFLWKQYAFNTVLQYKKENVQL